MKEKNDILTYLREKIHPPKEFYEKANIRDLSVYDKGKIDPEGFWENCAYDLFWYKKWDQVLEWKAPYAKWFLGGKINACYNCLDRHIDNGLGNKLAFIWESEQGDTLKITYHELFVEVNKFANVLKSMNVKKGDKVAIYLPLVMENIVAMLACARIGAVHVVIFGGIGYAGVRDRISNAEAKVLITADGGWRRGKVIPYKQIADNAVDQCPSIENVIVVKRTNEHIDFFDRDKWYHELMDKAEQFCEPEQMDSEDMLFILYTSGSTGKAKGIFHSTAGYLLGAYQTTKWVFDVKPEDIYFCTADTGWITGHTYVVYGPLSNGMTQVVYEGAFDFPDKDRFWKIVEKYKATIFYTAPTAIRTFMKWGTKWIDNCDISSLRLLGTIGEPINPDVWLWYYKNIGKEKCPIVDTWFQTETGALVISPLPGVTPLKPGSVTQALPGMKAEILDEEGNNVKKGFLALTQCYPSMLRGIYKDDKRYIDTYWCKWNGRHYYTGDGAYIDDDGYLWITGRLDDVMKISGHRIGTAEVESALTDHPYVAEASVVSVTDEIKGESIMAFVIIKEEAVCDGLEEELKKQVSKSIGSYAKPKKIFLVKELPKTRSGKIMRRILRNLIEKKPLGDISTLENSHSVNELEKCIIGV